MTLTEIFTELSKTISAFEWDLSILPTLFIIFFLYFLVSMFQVDNLGKKLNRIDNTTQETNKNTAEILALLKH